jgi:hypothetical protein
MLIIAVVILVCQFVFIVSDIQDYQRYVKVIAGPKVDPETDPSKFRIALIAAGELRSFSFVEASWKRYIFDHWKYNIFLFAHAVVAPHCPLSVDAVNRLSQIATVLDTSPPVPLVPTDVIWSRLPKHYSTTHRWTKIFGNGTRGNFIDMHARRTRAYNLAKTYASQHAIQWDLIVFTRFDTAFYEPYLNFYQWYVDIKAHNTKTGDKGIYIPSSCSYHGPCDRFAVGLPQDMDIYFEADWPFQVLDWVELPDAETEKYVKHMNPNMQMFDYVNHELKITMIVHDGNSEHLMELWFIMNNMTQIDFVSPVPVAFATLRAEHASAYCGLKRTDFSHKYPNPDQFIWDPDKQPMYDNVGSPAQGNDLVASSAERCGIHISHFNATEICLTHHACRCVPRGLYANVN